MKYIPAALLAHYASGSTTLCTCWKVTLTSNVVHTYTDHDTDVTFAGLVYESASGYTPSAIDSSSELNPDNLQIEGFLQAKSITEGDLHSGKWDYAYVEIFEINYLDPSMGRNVLRAGTLGEVKAGRAKFTAELRGLMQAYTKTIVRLTAKECNADLGDSRCQKDVTAFTYGPITVGTLSADFRTIGAAALASYADNWFTGGVVTWLTGDNADILQEVEYSVAGQFVLFQQPPLQAKVGDTFMIMAGCTKRFEEDCIAKYANGINFQGFPHVPQADAYKVGTNSGVV